MRDILLDEVFRLLEEAAILERSCQHRIEAATKYYEACYIMRQIVADAESKSTTSSQQTFGRTSRHFLRAKIDHYTTLARQLYFDEMGEKPQPQQQPATSVMIVLLDDAISVLTESNTTPPPIPVSTSRGTLQQHSASVEIQRINSPNPSAPVESPRNPSAPVVTQQAEIQKPFSYVEDIQRNNPPKSSAPVQNQHGNLRNFPARIGNKRQIAKINFKRSTSNLNHVEPPIQRQSPPPITVSSNTMSRRRNVRNPSTLVGTQQKSSAINPKRPNASLNRRHQQIERSQHPQSRRSRIPRCAFATTERQINLRANLAHTALSKAIDFDEKNGKNHDSRSKAISTYVEASELYLSAIQMGEQQKAKLNEAATRRPGITPSMSSSIQLVQTMGGSLDIHLSKLKRLLVSALDRVEALKKEEQKQNQHMGSARNIHNQKPVTAISSTITTTPVVVPMLESLKTSLDWLRSQKGNGRKDESGKENYRGPNTFMISR